MSDNSNTTQKTAEVSKETINNLIFNSGIAIDDLYKSLKRGLQARSSMNKSTPRLYVLTQDLQNGIKFILMDIAVSCRAEFLTNNIYEKRFHLKNIQASISEGYKLLFNFGKSRIKSLWKKLINELKEYDNTDDLIAEGDDIESRLIDFGNTHIDKTLRDLTLHYDKVMIEVYKKTVSINSEEKVIQLVCIFWKTLQDIILFTNKTDAYCFTQTGIKKTPPPLSIKLNINTQHKNVIRLIDRGGQIEDIFDNFFPEIVKSIDLLAKYFESSKHIKDYIHTKTSGIGEIVEIEYVQTLTNLRILMKFMMLDLASVVQSYIKSSSDIEFALNLRRVCVTKVSTMVHLYGYNENEERQSIWEKIKDLLPSNYSVLQEEFDSITGVLKKIVSNSNDKDLRKHFVHIFDNSKECTDIANVIQTIEEINPITQVIEIMLLLEVYKKIINFTTKLMNMLSGIAHDKMLQSNKAMNNKIDECIQIIMNTSSPDEYKKQMSDMFNELKRIINLNSI